MPELSWHQMNAAGMLAKSYDIVGYTYNADEYCPGCILQSMGKPRLPGKSVEDSLAVYARKMGIDSEDERSYDSGTFPKVIFRDSVHDVCNASEGYEAGQCGDSCGKCHKPLGGDCPNQSAEAGYHVQFCADGRDITGDSYAEQDAAEVRVWSADGTMILAVERITVRREYQWRVSASDVYGPWTEQNRTYRSWRDAMIQAPADWPVTAAMLAEAGY